MSDCAPSELVQAAACLQCIPSGLHPAIQTKLLCEVLDRVSPTYGFLSAYGQGSFINVIASGTYYPVNGYIDSMAENVVDDKAAGTLTIVRAGIYKVAFSCSFLAGINNEIEADIAQNGVPDDLVAAHASAATAGDSSISAIGILSLSVGEVLSIMMKNDDSTNLSLTHCQLSCHRL